MNVSSTAVEHNRRPSLAVLALVLTAGILVGGAGSWLTTRSSTPSSAEPVEPEPSHEAADAVELGETAQRNAAIEVVPVTRTSMRSSLDVTGIVTPDDSRVAHVRPLARGVVESIGVSLGSRVTKGQALLTYDNIELGQLVGDFLTEHAALRQAETDREVKRTSMARAEALIQIEAIARQDLEARRAEFANAEASVASARARVSRVEEQLHRFGLSDTDVRALVPRANEEPHRAASHSTLRAPFDGVVMRFDVAVGEVVESDKEIFTIADISTVWVLADVYEKDLAQISREGEVTVKVDAYPDRAFSGRIAHVSDLIDPTTRTAKVRCVVENRDGALKLDMFARVQLGAGVEREALTLPVDAIQQIDGHTVVFARTGPTTFERRVVQIGSRTRDRVEIASGVDEGLAVVGKGSFYLKTALLRESIGDEH